IDEHGYTTYGGNSHLFADENEGWVFVEFAGGEGLWAAERLGSDEIRVSYPGYIQEFPVEAVDGDHADYRGSDNLVDFAESEGWYDPASDDAFNLQDVYGVPFPTDEFQPNETADPEDEAPYRNPVSLEEEIATLDGSITLEDMMRLVRDPRWSDDRARSEEHTSELQSRFDLVFYTLSLLDALPISRSICRTCMACPSRPTNFNPTRQLTLKMRHPTVTRSP